VRDIVVVGGGPAGTTTALALAHAAPELASRVVLLEKARYPREKPCAGALGARGDALLRDIGVEVDVPAASIDGMVFRGANGSSQARPGRIGRVVRRIEFDHALAKAAASRGIEVRDGMRVESVEDGPGGARVRTSAGEILAGAVVGCDGVGSTVRKALGLGAGAYRAQVIEVDTEAVPGDVDRGLLVFDATDTRITGYAWDFPTVVGGRELVCRGLYHLRSASERHGPDIAALLAERLRGQGIDPARCVNKRYAERGFEPAGCVARGRLMLAGEAVGIDPATGEGIAQAIEYGVMAGRFLAGLLSGRGAVRDPDRDHDHDLRLDPWENELRRSRLARDLRIRTAIMRHFYGPERRLIEAFVAENPGALHVGCQHFAAQPYDWVKLADAAGRGAAHWMALKIGAFLGR
jgi:flavin-dependent dehydrogenase